MLKSSSVSATIKVFTDASLRYGAWIIGKDHHKTFAIPHDFQYSSYASEFYTAQQAIRDIAPLILIIAVIVVNRALSRILEPVNELYMLLGEDVAEIVIIDVDHNLLNTTGIFWEF
ncbi:hypothetical protein EDD11_009438 [Mortierella claussenii]|nr:hypothetical protein EDD11_009438 [Mortierella claussenii]